MPNNLYTRLCHANQLNPHTDDTSMISPYQSRSNMERSAPFSHSNTHQGQAMEWRYAPIQPTASSANGEKRVTFKPTATVRTYSSGNGRMTKDEISKLYYSKRELNIFALEVKAICTLSQELPRIRNSGTILDVAQDSMIPNDNSHDEAMDSLRGLELLMYPKRTQNKILAHRSLLKYQAILNSKPNMNSERKHAALAAASAKLNLWSSLVAVETARLDSIRAHERDYNIPIAIHAPRPSAAISPFHFYSKQRRRGSRRVTLDVGDASRQNKRRKTEQR